MKRVALIVALCGLLAAPVGSVPINDYPSYFPAQVWGLVIVGDSRFAAYPLFAPAQTGVPASGDITANPSFIFAGMTSGTWSATNRAHSGDATGIIKTRSINALVNLHPLAFSFNGGVNNGAAFDTYKQDYIDIIVCAATNRALTYVANEFDWTSANASYVSDHNSKLALLISAMAVTNPYVRLLDVNTAFKSGSNPNEMAAVWAQADKQHLSQAGDTNLALMIYNAIAADAALYSPPRPPLVIVASRGSAGLLRL